MDKITILWADDEIDLLKPQLLFLEEKGYDIIPVTNGQDAIDTCAEHYLDIVFLDEHMPGLSGLETLATIKQTHPTLPVVMITKNEEENIMDEALGSQIEDYLIKPVNPNQILLSIKKIIDNKRLVSEKTNTAYQQDFQKIFEAFNTDLDHQSWAEVYRKLVYWELELGKSENNNMQEVFNMQKTEANVEFCKFITRQYHQWLKDPGSGPIMSHTLFSQKIIPALSAEQSTFVVVVDNLRYDQWKMIQPIIETAYRVVDDEILYSILPTSTQYSRNAIFAGLLPSEIEEHYPEYWKNDEDEGGKNQFEKELLAAQLDRANLDIKFSYTKVSSQQQGKNLEDNILNLLHNTLNVIVYNFVDMLSHARTEMEVLKELAKDESAYRSITRSWFEHSSLHNALKKLTDKNINLIITSDHGTIRVKQPVKVIGDRNTTTNLRYKHGKNLNYNPKEVFEIRDPKDFFLPRPHVSSRFIFAKNEDFFAYPNNYNYYVNYYKDTFQHGGISLEEMIIPLVTLTAK